MKKLFLFMIIFLANSVMATSWINITGNDNAQIYVDVDSIKKDILDTYYWRLIDVSKQMDDREDFRSVKIYIQLDCDKGRHKILSYFYYAERMGTGTSWQEDPVDKDWRYDPPGTIANSANEFACSYGN